MPIGLDFISMYFNDLRAYDSSLDGFLYLFVDNDVVLADLFIQTSAGKAE